MEGRCCRTCTDRQDLAIDEAGLHGVTLCRSQGSHAAGRITEHFPARKSESRSAVAEQPKSCDHPKLLRLHFTLTALRRVNRLKSRVPLCCKHRTGRKKTGSSHLCVVMSDMLVANKRFNVARCRISEINPSLFRFHFHVQS